MNTRTIAEALTVQYRYTGHAIRANLLGMSDEDGLVQPAPAGNCANWVAGHIAHSRVGTLALLGSYGPFLGDKYDRYVRGSEPLTGDGDAVPLTEIVADLESSHLALLAALEELTDEALGAAAPVSFSGEEDETLGAVLAGLVFHEAYHAGQLGVLRRLGGHDGVIR